MAESLLLMSAWRRVLAGLGVDLSGAVLLAAPDGAGLATAAGAPVRQEGVTLVTLGAGDVPALGDSANPLASGAPDASFDAVVMLAAWDGPRELLAVAAEARRIVRPGCRVWLGDIDAQTIVTTTPAGDPRAVLYRTHPEVGARLVADHEGSSRMALAALGAGIHPIRLDRADLPIGAFTDSAEYLEAVRGGLWPGSEWLDEATLDAVLVAAGNRLRGVSFPMVVTQPWLLVSGPRSR